MLFSMTANCAQTRSWSSYFCRTAESASLVCASLSISRSFWSRRACRGGRGGEGRGGEEGGRGGRQEPSRKVSGGGARDNKQGLPPLGPSSTLPVPPCSASSPLVAPAGTRSAPWPRRPQHCPLLQTPVRQPVLSPGPADAFLGPEGSEESTCREQRKGGGGGGEQ